MSRLDHQERFCELLERSHARWTGIARAYAPPDDRDDLVQEIAMHVWKGLDRFAGRSELDTWAYRIALNTAMAWKRKAKGRSEKLKRTAQDVAALPGDKTPETEVTAVLDRFLASLSKADRAVMLLYLDGVPNADAASVLGTTEGALRVRLHRIRTRFEAAHGPGEGDDAV
ncbi:MAG: sigma-70 family RNA polymerase sigma factor [Planctomycetota bacterium]